MYKEFSLSKGKAMMNFNVKFCESSEQLIDSVGFKRVTTAYIERIKKKNSEQFTFIKGVLAKDVDESCEIEEICNLLYKTFKLLLVFPAAQIVNMGDDYSFLISKSKECEDFIEGLYNYWRKLERYIIINDTKNNEGILSVSFIDAASKFSNLVISTYRKIEENLLGRKPKVYRQLPAGGNGGFTLSNVPWQCPEEYEILKDIPFIKTIAIDTPFIIYPSQNTRSGVFNETFENPIKDLVLNKDHFFCYPAKVGKLIAFIYFHRDFTAHGITLCNLFELAEEEAYVNKKPDLIFVFGGRKNSGEEVTEFFDDAQNKLILGFISNSTEIDYFGYLKKMTLTLHNIFIMKKKLLPIHGAMVNIKMKEGKTSNIVIMGDSGAGKSECLEAFRELGEEYISDMTVIFDDMGYIEYGKDNKPKGYGTETGAFVRLDDLGPGYAFKEIDRSIFMNPDKINARLVIPITSYEDITKGYPVDLFLYANNYSKPEGDPLCFFNSIKEAMDVFVDGARMAKGTTSEKGLVKSFFANPFGPLQRKETCLPMIEECLNDMKNKDVKIGEIKTCLGISGMEKDGPTNAAKRLLEYLLG